MLIFGPFWVIFGPFRGIFGKISGKFNFFAAPLGSRDSLLECMGLHTKATKYSAAVCSMLFTGKNEVDTWLQCHQ